MPDEGKGRGLPAPARGRTVRRRHVTGVSDVSTLLRDVIVTAAAGTGPVVCIALRPEESRLRVEAQAQAHAEGVRIVTVECKANGRPLAPWARLASRIGLQQPRWHGGGRVPRFLAMQAYLAAFGDPSHRGPVVAILSDLQRADRASLLLLEMIASAPLPSLAVLGTYANEPPAGSPLGETLAELRKGSTIRPDRQSEPVDGEESPKTAVGVLRRDGEYWTLWWQGTLVRVRDSKGLRYMEPLLRQPGVLLPAERLLANAVSAANLIGTGGSRERVRLRVTKGISAALLRIARSDPSLGAHLRATVRCGYSCVYRPVPEGRVVWRR